MNKKQQKITPEELLLGFTPHIIACAEQLRTLIRKIVPDAIEKGYPTWRGIGYTHPRAGYFCAIFPEESLVKLAFEWGALLPDAAGVLRGEGRQVRYLYFYQAEDIQEGSVADLIEAALALPPGRAERLSLLNSYSRSAND
jgi:hypothetical protein